MNSTWASSALFLPAISSLFTSLSPSLLPLPSLSCSPFPPSLLLLFLHPLPAHLPFLLCSSLAHSPVVIWEGAQGVTPAAAVSHLAHTGDAPGSPCRRAVSSPHVHGVSPPHSNPTALAPEEIFPGFGSLRDGAWPGD